MTLSNHFSTWNKSLETDPARHTSTSKCHCPHFVSSSSSSSPLAGPFIIFLFKWQTETDRTAGDRVPKGAFVLLMAGTSHFFSSCLRGIGIPVHSTDCIMDSLINLPPLDGRSWKILGALGKPSKVIYLLNYLRICGMFFWPLENFSSFICLSFFLQLNNKCVIIQLGALRSIWSLSKWRFCKPC